VGNDFKNASTIASNTKTYINEVLDRGDKVLVGVDTGYYELNKMTSGFGKGDLIIIAARPSVGTTSFALNITQNLLDKEKGVAIVSLEMSAEQMMLRLLSIKTTVPLKQLRVGNISPEVYKRIDHAIEEMEYKKLFIHDQSLMNIDVICSKLRQLKSQTPEIELAIIDSLQLIRSSSEKDVGEISSELKMLSQELEIPILVLSKLSSKLESRSNKRPMLSDIPASDLIEPYADTILLIYRDNLYTYNEEKAREKKAIAAGKEFISRYVEKLEDEAEIIVAKQCNGSLGYIKLLFQQEFTRFIDRYTFGNIQLVDTSVNIAN
jgi:replicative DNA helicase